MPRLPSGNAFPPPTLSSIWIVHGEFSSVWRLKSWDRFRLPKPFSRVRVIFDEALAVPSGLSEDEFETWRARIEANLRAGVGDFTEQT